MSAFAAEMIPHHEAAVDMASTAAKRRRRPEVKPLAQASTRTQSAEIAQMNTWRVDWFGSVSPAGGVPPESGSDHAGHRM